jgi:signal transduction histidine kinase
MMKRNGELINLYWRYWPIFAGVLISFYIVWVLFTPESFGGGFFPATLVFALRAAATYVALKSFPHIVDEGQRRAWRYFGVGLWLWTISDAVDIVAWGVRGEPWSEPAFSDLLHVAGYLAFLTGCASYPQAQPGRFGRIREALEVSILAIAVLSISWMIYLSPSIDARTFQVDKLIWLTVSPIMDLILTVLGLRLILLQHKRFQRLALSLFSFAFIVLFVSDMASSYSQVVARATIPSMTQAGWMAATTFLGLAFQWFTAPAVGRRDRMQTNTSARWIWRFEPLIPLAFTYTVLGYVLFDWWFSGGLDWLGLAGAGALIVLIFARQGVIAGQREMSQFVALVNSTSDMAFILDPSGKVMMANPSFSSLFEDNVESSRELILGDFIHTGDSIAFEVLLEQAASAGWSGEVMLVREGKPEAPILLSLNPLTQDPRDEKLLAGTAHDLSEIRQRENELRQALDEVRQARSALEQLNVALEDKVADRTNELAMTVKDLERLNQELLELDQLKSEFVALVSHELRAPMTNIRGGIELLLGKYPEIEGAPKKSLALVQAEVERLSRFVEIVLDLSALEAGRFPIELEPVPVEDLLKLVLGRFPSALQKRVRLEVAERARNVQADEAGLESVFFHLLDNAFKYSPKGKISIVLQPDGDLVKCRIQDTGPGIPAGEHERIFEMFHRLDTRDSREVYGYGLGLPMVKRLLTAMGGRIEAKDCDGGGTEMVFWLPQLAMNEVEAIGREG